MVDFKKAAKRKATTMTSTEFDKRLVEQSKSTAGVKWKGAPPPPDWKSFPELAEMEFDRKLKRYRAIVEQAKALEIEKKELGQQIECGLMVIDRKSVAVGDIFAVQANGRTAGSLSKAKLLEQGVEAGVIEAAWVPGREYTYVQVKKLGEKDNE